jgi:hypothetical protein
MALLPKQRNLSSAEENHIVDAQSNAALRYEEPDGYSGRGKAPVSRCTSRASARTHPYSRRHSKMSAPESPSNAPRFQWDEVKMQREATKNALLSWAPELYTLFSAGEYIAATHERINIQDIEARILNRLEELRIDYWAHVNHTNQPDHGQSTHQTLPLHPTPTPIIISANDFSTPSRPAHSFIGQLQRPGSDNGTRSISQEYHIEDTSPGFRDSDLAYPQVNVPGNIRAGQGNDNDDGMSQHRRDQYVNPMSSPERRG